MRRAVADRLGYDPFDRVAPQLFRTRVSRSGVRFSALLELVDSAGRVRATRQLESAEDCTELVAAVALSMSIVIDPEHAERASASASAEAAFELADVPAATSAPGISSANTTTAPPDDAPPPSLAPPSPRNSGQGEPAVRSRGTARILGRLGATGHLSLGAEPAPSVGGSLLLGVRRGRWSLALEGRYDAPASRAIEPRGRVSAQVVSAGVVPCVHVAPLLFCGVGALGSLRAGASGVSAGRTDSALFAAAGARLGAEWPLKSGFSAQFLTDALVTIRPRSVLLNDYSVWELPSVTGRLAVGFIAEF